MKKTYQSPHVCAYKIIGKKFLLNPSLSVNESKVSNNNDIGFVKEQNTNSDNNNIWDNEW